MGYIAIGSCRCGFKTGNLNLGGGRRNFKSFNGVPALDKHGVFTVANYFEIENRDSFIFYNDPLLQLKNPPVRTYLWDDVYLQQTQNYCPKCKNFTLQFELIGNWD